jgi:sulfite reductase alpha subunit-like flavoprotein
MNTQRYAGELQYKPGDHVGIFATNRKELVDAILSKVSNAPPSDQLIKIEILKEKATVFGSLCFILLRSSRYIDSIF